jgi:hypothetical protein
MSITLWRVKLTLHMNIRNITNIIDAYPSVLIHNGLLPLYPIPLEREISHL